MKNFLVGLGFLSILLTAGGCKKKSAPPQAPLPVNVVTAVEKEVNEWDEFTGRLEAVESVEIRPVILLRFGFKLAQSSRKMISFT